MRMRTLGWLLAAAGIAPVLTAGVAAGVNCDQVRRYLQTGRSVEDVADTMVLSVDDVKKCQQSTSGHAGDRTAAPTPPASGQKRQ